MVSTSGAGQVTDPTLASLVPRRSSRRNLTLLLAAVLTLVAVGWYGSSGRPTLSSDAGSATAVSGRQVLLVLSSTAGGIPAPTLESVTAPPWTDVVGTWVLDTDDPLALQGTAPTDPDATRDALVAGDRGDQALPQSLPTDREFVLVVLVDVVDCSALPEDGLVPSRDQWAAVRLRSAFTGTTTALLQPLDWMLDRQALTSEGICPVG